MSSPFEEGAFPLDGERGMTLEDYFAARAMQSLIAAALANIKEPDLQYLDEERIAEMAYVIASAMISYRQNLLEMNSI